MFFRFLLKNEKKFEKTAKLNDFNNNSNLNNFDNKSKESNYTFWFSNDKKICLINFFSFLNGKIETFDELNNFINEEKRNNKNSLILICGMDLILKKEEISKFFLKTKSSIFNDLSPYVLIFNSLYETNQNLTSDLEEKKSLIKSKLNLFIKEKTQKHFSGKLFKYFEVFNFQKLSKEILIFEYEIFNNNNNNNNNNSNKINSLFIFEKFALLKISVYTKEHKQIFETKTEEDKDESSSTIPTSTFKLTLNEKELKAKNEVILPYIKNSNLNENIIQIDQEDLNELYEEDPDGDLDI